MVGRCRARSLLVLAAAIIALLGWPGSAGAQTITEYNIPIITIVPGGITAGPDGALWFTAGGIIGRITTSGNSSKFTGATGHSGMITTGPDGTLWFTESPATGSSESKIGRITTSGAITEYVLPTSSVLLSPGGIVSGPDGALWFTEPDPSNKIGRITTSGLITEYPLPASFTFPYGIAVGSDGALWFTNTGPLPAINYIGRITTAGSITEYPTPPDGGGVAFGITAGPDGALWYAKVAGGGTSGHIGRITTSGTVTEYATPNSLFEPSITTGSDGALWFTEGVTGSGQQQGIGRITTAGTITQYPCNDVCQPGGIAAGPDGALWFVETSAADKIGRITTGNSTGLLAAVLPSSRSIQVGGTATAFATMINSSSSAASSCGIVPVTPVPASFTYQTTNPATNALTGAPNTPGSIAAGGSQSFVVAFTPNAPVVPTTVALGFSCSGLASAASNPGLNTLLFSASTTPVPDIVALAATATNDGTLHISSSSGSNAFAVATANVGAEASITASANTGAMTLPLAITACQTNPQTGQCLAAPAASALASINPGETPTFAFFAAASGQIPFLPAVNRIFVQFTDRGGTVRGSTSVAVQTQ